MTSRLSFTLATPVQLIEMYGILVTTVWKHALRGTLLLTVQTIGQTMV